MKKILKSLLLLSVVFLLLSACEKQDKEPGVADKVQEMAKSRKDALDNSKVVAQKTELANLKAAINAYNAAEGRFPKDLTELEQFSGSAIDKGVYNYDPQSGALSLK
ncbi:hypothetical protein [Candidatus Magnetomonas plexicatena]|uniref:hypothetical protein n=1 Tax=Candidatus Magnetomonas plexicatena TaxID=2552947 RepID=UPI001C74CCB4|nr:hypothetical protein E2O03_012630 [Nitrospirales bacterium LBB_01]